MEVNIYTCIQLLCIYVHESYKLHVLLFVFLFVFLLRKINKKFLCANFTRHFILFNIEGSKIVIQVMAYF